MSASSLMSFLILLGASFLLGGCATKSNYTSLDLDLLPCESGDAPRFFHSVEFDAMGKLRYPEQIRGIERRYAGHVTDVVVFVHGWNKNPTSAESDYQDFLCRLHGKMRDVIGDRKRVGGLVVIGVFWPSTISGQQKDPLLAKPASYFKMRDRADHIARTGLYELFLTIGKLNGQSLSGMPERVQLVGHSFGARMVLASLSELNDKGELDNFLGSSKSANVVLLNAAVAPDRFLWLPGAMRASAVEAEMNSRAEVARSQLFNVHSHNDDATRHLFPIASLFNDEPAVCAAGACGVPEFMTVTLGESGDLELPEDDCPDALRSINAWNVDATAVVASHTGIYKGRIATLLSRLTYDDELKDALPVHGCVQGSVQ
ncbi:hypothetical protein LJR143_001176 [Pseudoxanthomonas sp. LjRoot143]|uniref:hypothetical protein n=1 Tax=Pseudoxanthomonas sp. LjRoot143 TaxID=3342266 RepID=UPI003ED1623D